LVGPRFSALHEEAIWLVIRAQALELLQGGCVAPLQYRQYLTKSFAGRMPIAWRHEAF
jgi:hypothetical protein